MLNCITLCSDERVIFLAKITAVYDDRGRAIIDKKTKLFPYKEDNLVLYKVDKLFFSSVKEEEWLNLLASKGYVLQKRKLSGYVFAFDASASEYYYSVCVLPAPAESEVSSAVIKERVKNGGELVYTYANKAYFRTDLKKDDAFAGVLSDATSKRRHIRNVFAFNASMLAFWLGLLCYNLIYWVRFDSAGVVDVEKKGVLWDYTIDMSAVFGDYPTTPYISLFLVLTVLFLPSVIYFLDQYLYSRRFEKGAYEKCVRK